MIRSAKLPLVLAALALPACSFAWSDEGDAVQPSGSGDRRSYAVRDFDTVALGAAGDVEVRVGGDYSVTATGAPAALDKLRVERDGKTLKLERRRGMQWGSGDKVRFLVTMPRIAGADIGGAGNIRIDRAAGPAFEGNIGGSGTLDVRGLAVDTATFSIGGSGNVSAAGRTRQLEVNIGGSGDVRTTPLSAQDAEVTIAGAGKVAATVARTADVTIMGSGDVSITGGAKCSVTKMGGGTVRCG